MHGPPPSPPDPPDPVGPEATRPRWLAFGASALAVALPFAVVTFPPASDLAQHVAQIRLLDELLGLAPATTDPGLLHVLWGRANSLVYLPLFAAVHLAGPVPGGKLLLGALALAQVAAVHAVAARRGRPIGAALLASTLVFSQSLYWGFLNFLLAIPLFLLLVDRAARAPDPARRSADAAITGALALATYLAHSVLFAAGALAVFAYGWFRRDPLRAQAARLGSLLPTVALAGAWFSGLVAARRDAGSDLRPLWGSTPLHRLHPGSVVDLCYGGLHGWLEPVAVLVLAAWLAASVATHGRRLREAVDADLLALAGWLFLLVLTGPNQWVNTLLFSDRFGPLAVAALLLALPAPAWRPALARAAAGAWALLFGAAVAIGWARFEATELSGLRASLAAVPAPSRVLGLDYVRESAVVKGLPFLQLSAWTQARNGGELNFSFAEHASSIVAWRAPRVLRWTPGLEWFPETVTEADLLAFDVAMVVGTDEQHAAFAAFAHATPLVTSGRVRAYRLR